MTPQKERELIKEIAQIKNSRPQIEQIQKLQEKINALRAQQKKESEELPQINKMLDSIKQRIEKVKGQQNIIETTQDSYKQ
jgi:uncharacterized coiled-coil DUF342 family protein